VVVQDPATAVVGSMPQAVLDAGLASAVLSPAALVDELRARLGGVRR
jgi:chemotaxis response regulator CheB